MPNFRTVHYRIGVDRTRFQPESPFSAVFLSDLHNASYGEKNRELLDAVCAADPAAVLIGGDMLTAGHNAKAETDAALALMEALAGQYPVYYVNGNHETRLKGRIRTGDRTYEEYAKQICGFGVHLLGNTSVQIVIRGMPVEVWGLELPMDYYQLFHRKKLTEETMHEMLGALPDDGAFHLLLAHNPVYFDVYAAWGADLTLSGHLHGGIVRLPLLGGVASPQFRPFPKYDRGLYEKDGHSLVVSAGLGEHTIPLRINNPRELIVLDFE